VLSGRGARSLKEWLEREAETARSNHDLARRFVKECRRAQSILPGVSIIERLCTYALVAAERRIENQIVNRLHNDKQERLQALLAEMIDGNVGRFVWLRQLEVGSNSAGASRLGQVGILAGLGTVARYPGRHSTLPDHAPAPPG